MKEILPRELLPGDFVHDMCSSTSKGGVYIVVSSKKLKNFDAFRTFVICTDYIGIWIVEDYYPEKGFLFHRHPVHETT